MRALLRAPKMKCINFLQSMTVKHYLQVQTAASVRGDLGESCDSKECGNGGHRAVRRGRLI